MTLTTWADYSFARPTPKVLKGAGHAGVIRYVSHTSAKNLTKPEARALIAAGLDIALVWEDGATRSFEGAAAGTADGHEAVRQAEALGYPKGATIFCSTDDNAATVARVKPYSDAFAAVVKRAGYTDGGYGSGVIARLRTVHWKVETWGGADSAAHLVQMANNPPRLVSGTDTNIVQHSFPSWLHPHPAAKVARPPAKKVAPSPNLTPIVNSLNAAGRKTKSPSVWLRIHNAILALIGKK
jgi:hypothetical protein